uniref:Uncharacterized protein n=1 Tax=Dermanyssus gallinae TaxID=34641 RepID=A0A0M4FS50_9ACAR|nr:hypothetical protein [Dermanyssus gallinae]
MLFKLLLVVGLTAAIASAGRGSDQRDQRGGRDHSHDSHHGSTEGGRRDRETTDPLFAKFMETTKKCVNDLLPQSGLEQRDQQALLEMIKPMHVLQREHSTDQSGRQHAQHTFTPPYKCSPQGELLTISPAEVYVTSMGKHLDATDKVSQRAKAQKVFRDALPCMEEIFKNQPSPNQKSLSGQPGGPRRTHHSTSTERPRTP